MGLSKFIAFSTLGVVLGVGLVQSQPASAKRQPSTLMSDSTEASVKQYQVSKGVIYKNFNLTKVKATATKYKNTVFYSDETITVKRPNGKKAVYRVLANRYGKEFGFIWHGYANKIKTLSWNFGDFDAPNKKSDNESQFFNSDELQQIKQIRTKANGIYNSDKNLYTEKPTLSGTFNPGKLTDNYIQGTVDWINLYRGLYGLSAIKADSGWNTEAQYGAATLAAADEGLSHGLKGIAKPANVSDADWQRGAKATASSNLGVGAVSPEGNVTLYLQDNGNDVPGHRDWLLGGITQVGVGQAGEYNDLKVFDADNYSENKPSSMLKFPNAGIFPYEVSTQTRWSLSLPKKIAKNANPSVKVYDNTTNKNISVQDVNVDNSGYGYFGTTISYNPDENQVKLNHSYTITLSNLPDGQSDVAYNTKLFSINR